MLIEGNMWTLTSLCQIHGNPTTRDRERERERAREREREREENVFFHLL